MQGITRLVAAGAFAVATAFVGVGVTASKSEAAVINLGFAFDASGSVGASDYNTAKAALSQALAVIPTSGPNVYQISVVEFGFNATTVINRVINSAGALQEVRDAVANMNRAGIDTGATCISCSTQLLTQNVNNVFSGFGDLNLINIMTDGVPNVGNSNGSTLRAETLGAGWDAISAEAVGGGASQSFLLDLTDAAAVTNDPNNLPTDPLVGFVLALANFDAYAAAIDLKVANIVDNVGQTPIPGALPLFATGLGAMGFVTWRRRKKAQAA